MNDEVRKLAEQIKYDWQLINQDNQKLSKAFDLLVSGAQELKDRITGDIQLSDAINCIRTELLADKQPGSYYYTWQCNIAMCFYNEFNKQCDNKPLEIIPQRLHKIANEAAKNFLDILCLPTNNSTDWTKQTESPKLQSIAQQQPPA